MAVIRDPEDELSISAKSREHSTRRQYVYPRAGISTSASIGGQGEIKGRILTSANLEAFSASFLQVKQRVRGIEPPCAAWEAAVLPLNYTRVLEEVNSESFRE